MTLTPILQSTLAIQLHVLAAAIATVLGIIQFAGIKGTIVHRILGYGWVTAMAIVAISSFWIFEFRFIGLWSPIHLLSIGVLVALPFAVLHARRGRIDDHRSAMIWMFAGALAVAGFFTFLPGRIMHAVLFGG
ncbi:DUF2306 domain-containing protein [Fodinicurvata sp. EGI_FJ10296]|uniref:DUF2306 domain-containing protein n=1 Tax=Fodinicurvata sp. EGI_FJ10296 TaxID=3231908 RepID=UPI003454FE39